ncbi:MAG: hypothetical protein CVV49_08790 [Spirochaetae bacterium HGW-Spirochaetae-5]|nr:MAG: hypothetical protein CVV49_08790 [Spirochaetae bacterium HGW-Spirochaetae-5]
MNISLDITTIYTAAGFIIFFVVMWKSNRNGFKAIEASSKNGFKAIEASNKSSFDMIDLKFSNLTAMLALERDGMKRDIDCTDEDIESVKRQLKDVIYPRLNTVESAAKKNCQAIEDFKELCKIKCKV